jgi:hypothetical protein
VTTGALKWEELEVVACVFSEKIHAASGEGTEWKVALFDGKRRAGKWRGNFNF